MQNKINFLKQTYNNILLRYYDIVDFVYTFSFLQYIHIELTTRNY